MQRSAGLSTKTWSRKAKMVESRESSLRHSSIWVCACICVGLDYFEEHTTLYAAKKSVLFRTTDVNVWSYDIQSHNPESDLSLNDWKGFLMMTPLSKLILTPYQNSLFKLFEHKCVLEVSVHIHPIMIKIHPVFFFKSPFSNQAVLRFLSEWL